MSRKYIPTFEDFLYSSSSFVNESSDNKEIKKASAGFPYKYTESYKDNYKIVTIAWLPDESYKNISNNFKKLGFNVSKTNGGGLKAIKK